MRTWPILLALGACAEPAIEMSLDMPQAPAGFEVGCVTSIETLAFGEFQGDENNAPDIEGGCIDVQGMSSFGDIQRAMAGKFTIDLPESGLVGLGVRGSTGTCDDNDFHESVFYGGAPVDGDSVTIPIVASLSCSARGKIASVHPVDMLALHSAKQCPVSGEGRAFSGNYRPLLLGDAMPAMTFEFGSSASSQWTAGTTKIEVFAQAASARTCVAVGYESLIEVGGSRCIEDGLPTLCAVAGEHELPIIAFDYSYQSRDEALVAKYGEPVIGAVWEIGTAATKVPISGATVTLEDPTQGVVVYVDKAPTKFVARVGATATNADGFFMVYTKGAPTNITVTSPLHGAVRYKVATSADYPATLIAALTRR